MDVLLRDWDRADRSWLLDTSSGRAVTAAKGPFQGFLRSLHSNECEPGVPIIAAVYAESDSLWFQADDKRWKLDELEFRSSVGLVGNNRFTTLRQGKVILDISYTGPFSDLLYRNDPTFDELDLELIDFFYFISANAGRASWRSSVLAEWSRGISQ
jgi:hypothetical protein